MKSFAAAGSALLAVALACGRTPEVRQQGGSAPATVDAKSLAMFAPLPATMATTAASPAEIALGRALYHDTRLSNNHNVSCNSCHPLNGYGADGRARSFGDHGQTGGRNAPTVYNAAGHVAQFWDGRAPDVEAQAKGPILNPAEMGMPDSAQVLAHLTGSPEYQAAFRAAFPRDRQPVTYDNVGKAIGAFERGLVTPSKWDRFLNGDSAALTATEKRGFNTFVSTGCAGCHNGAYVGGNGFQKLGLVNAYTPLPDSGRITVTHAAGDLHVFKVPSLRNVDRTGPYFHDGSIATLPEAVRLMAKHQLGKSLTDGQVNDIVAWLGTLTGDLPTAYIAYPQLPAAKKQVKQ